MSSAIETRVQQIFRECGVVLNGKNPWDIIVHDNRFYARVFGKGSLGFGESYMDAWWDCEQIDECITRLLRTNIRSHIKPNLSLVKNFLWARIVNQQQGSQAFKNAQAHYDIGNDLYTAMLDSRLTYTCGYWKEATTLEQAQEAKLDLVCRKIGLKPGQRVLDIGCGWGSFAKFAAERYGAEVVGITVSEEQLALGKKLCEGLPIELRLEDYREVNEQFDHIVSLGMLEHVGYKNYRTYFEVVKRSLKDDGIFLLHTIGGNKSVQGTDPWIGTYIFPNSQLPSAAQLTKASEGLFVMEDWHNFSAYYDKTLMAWYHNIEKNWSTLGSRYDERFRLMWRYYLLSCAGSFRARVNQLWQIVYSKQGIPGGYTSIR